MKDTMDLALLTLWKRHNCPLFNYKHNTINNNNYNNKLVVLVSVMS